MEDKLHFFTEECDHLQGVQLVADTHNGGFGAVAAGIAQHLHDEYGSKSLFCITAVPPLTDTPVVCLSICLYVRLSVDISLNSQSPQLLLHYTLNSALAINQLAEHSSSLLPLSLSSVLWPFPNHPLLFPSLHHSVRTTVPPFTLLI